VELVAFKNVDDNVKPFVVVMAEAMASASRPG
jgi:hypothetical protein